VVVAEVVSMSLTDQLVNKKYLLLDRDTTYGAAFSKMLEQEALG
jgi:hypothetical protein